jgi:hypothetical protein
MQSNQFGKGRFVAGRTTLHKGGLTAVAIDPGNGARVFHGQIPGQRHRRIIP